MTCYFPVKMYKVFKGNGEYDWFHSPHQIKSKNYTEATRRCGQCIGCRLRNSREWAVRCMHEASLYWDNCWLTLTLNDDYKNTRQNPYSLERGQKSEITRFLKRLRNKYGQGIRYYYCGEYGETCFFCNKSEPMCLQHGCKNYVPWRGRPHYHVCVFNFDFDDKEFYKERDGMIYYTSESLQSLWTDPVTGLEMGQCLVTDLTPDSAAYTARYSLKKMLGLGAKNIDPVTGLKHYQRITSDGEIIDLEPEYTNMSRGSKKLGTGGIGKNWLEKYYKEVLDNDSVFFKTLGISTPRYYDNWLAEVFPKTFEEKKQKRLDKVKPMENTKERLEVKEHIASVKLKQLHRKEI